MKTKFPSTVMVRGIMTQNFLKQELRVNADVLKKVLYRG